MLLFTNVLCVFELYNKLFLIRKTGFNRIIKGYMCTKAVIILLTQNNYKALYSNLN